MTDRKVVAINGKIAATTGEPDSDTVELLKKMLQRAEIGEITGVAIVTVTGNGTIGTAWKGACDAMRMAAGVGLLNHRYWTSYHESPDL